MTTSKPAAGPASNDYLVVCDGSFYIDSKAGGWAAKVTKTEGGACARMLCSAGRTHSCMEAEAQAVILGLSAVPEGCRVTVQMDQCDLIKCINSKSNSFKSKSLQQSDCIANLLYLCARRVVCAVWVKSHSTHKDHNACDKLARQKARELARKCLPITC